MSEIDKVIQERKRDYYRALVELQEKFAAEFEALADEEHKTIGSEAKHMAKSLHYEAAKARREHLRG
jgi:hypothetical protein